MASAVATNEFGTVSTASARPMPHASRAKRRASVPLLTPTQCRVPQNSANALSNCSSIGPLVKTAVLNAWPTTARISSCSSRCGLTRSRNGIGEVSFMVAPLRFRKITKNSRRIAGRDAVGGNIPCDYAAGAHHRVLADGHIGQNGCSRADGRACAHAGRLHRPVLLGLQVAGDRGPRVSVVDKDNAVADEHIVFDGDALTDEAMAGDFAPAADLCILLDL